MHSLKEFRKNRRNNYANSRSFSKFLGQRFCSERAFEKLRILPIFKAFSGENIKPKNRENDRERVYTHSRSQHRIKGFVLLEVIIALMIVGLLGTLSIRGLSAYHKFNAEKITAERIDIITRAFALSLHNQHTTPHLVGQPERYPTWANQKSENNFWHTNVPIEALGLPKNFAKDGYGRPITYIVAKRASGAPRPHKQTTQQGMPQYILVENFIIDDREASEGNTYLLVLITYNATDKESVKTNHLHQANTLKEQENMQLNAYFFNTPKHKIHAYTDTYLHSLLR